MFTRKDRRKSASHRMGEMPALRTTFTRSAGATFPASGKDGATIYLATTFWGVVNSRFEPLSITTFT